MSLDATTLGALMVTKLAALPANTSQAAICVALADAIISHFKTSAVVNVASVTGITTGSGISGAGSGTLT
jgi:hypothetical protein